MTDSFMLSTIGFYLHTDLALTNRRLYAVRPNTLFGLIRVGTSRANYPIENIAGVRAGSRFRVFGVVLGVFAVLFGLLALSLPGIELAGILLLLLGIVTTVGAPQQAIAVMNSGGGEIEFRVSVLERGRTVEFTNKVSEAIARTSSRQPQAPVAVHTNPADDPSVALRRLQALKEQGLVTDTEYEAKRREILARF